MRAYVSRLEILGLLCLALGAVPVGSCGFIDEPSGEPATASQTLLVDPGRGADAWGYPPAVTSVVQTVYGRVRGRVDGSASPVQVFLKIPYAAAPIGQRRWASPQEPEPWEGILNATERGPVCLQFGPDGDLIGDEDCLTLAVWAPLRVAEPRPVMVWIHGGGGLVGSGTDPLTDPRALVAQQGVVVVAMNYRLGSLGFMSDPDWGLFGNYGIQDQRRALEWIQDNIAAFGGDPDRVTLWGLSAGSNSVCRHLVAAPSDRGPLFHRAIMQSGTCAVEPPGTNQGSLDMRPALEALCPDLVPDPADPRGPEARLADGLDCVRGLPTADILAAEVGGGPLGEPSERVFAWQPVLDGILLTAPSLYAFAHGWLHPDGLSLIIGATDDEGTSLVPGVDRVEEDGCDDFGEPDYYAHLMSRMCGLLGTLGLLPWNNTLVNFIMGFYDTTWLWPEGDYQPPEYSLGQVCTLFDSEPPVPGVLQVSSPSIYSIAADFEGDWRMVCPTHSSARWSSAHSVDTFLYLYDQDAPPSLRHLLGGCDAVYPFGAMHGSDIPVLFGWEGLGADETALGDRMRGYWARFAATGDPNPDPGAPEWPAYETAIDTHLVLTSAGGGPSAQTGMHSPRCACAMDWFLDAIMFGEVDPADLTCPFF